MLVSLKILEIVYFIVFFDLREYLQEFIEWDVFVLILAVFLGVLEESFFHFIEID